MGLKVDSQRLPRRVPGCAPGEFREEGREEGREGVADATYMRMDWLSGEGEKRKRLGE